MKNKKFTSLLEPLAGLCGFLKKTGCPWMIIGGVAVSLMGKPRFTADIDAVLWGKDEDIPLFLKQAQKLGIAARIKDAAKFAQKNRVLLLQHSKTGINLDISLGMLPFEREALQRSRQVQVANIPVNLPTPEDLIIFKAVAHRPRDIIDIAGILEAHPRIDKKRLSSTVKEFAEVMEMPEIWADLSRLLA